MFRLGTAEMYERTPTEHCGRRPIRLELIDRADGQSTSVAVIAYRCPHCKTVWVDDIGKGGA